MSSNQRKSVPKDARWDRIRKKHATALNIKTEAVKKFIEMDLIGKREMQLLNGDLEHVKSLDPMLVMDLRHEKTDRKPKPCLELSPRNSDKTAKAKEHNMRLEERYIEGELNKFKLKLQQNSKASKATKIELPENKEDAALATNLKDSRKKERVNGHAPLQENKQSYNRGEEDPINGLRHCPSNNINGNHLEKNVRFEDSVEVINYPREDSVCSNTSEDMDSVISEFIEEVIHEIEFEACEGELSDNQFEPIALCVKNTCEEELSSKALESTKCFNKSVCTKQCKENTMKPKLEHDLHTEDFLHIIRIPEESNVKLVVEIHSEEEEESSSQSESISNEQDAIIAQLFVPKLPPKEALMRKYFLKWIHFTTVTSVEKHNLINKSDRVHKINAFLDKIRKEKGRFCLSKPKVDGKKEMPSVATKKYEKK